MEVLDAVALLRRQAVVCQFLQPSTINTILYEHGWHLILGPKQRSQCWERSWWSQCFQFALRLRVHPRSCAYHRRHYVHHFSYPEEKSRAPVCSTFIPRRFTWARKIPSTAKNPLRLDSRNQQGEHFVPAPMAIMLKVYCPDPGYLCFAAQLARWLLSPSLREDNRGDMLCGLLHHLASSFPCQHNWWRRQATAWYAYFWSVLNFLGLFHADALIQQTLSTHTDTMVN